MRKSIPVVGLICVIILLCAIFSTSLINGVSTARTWLQSKGVKLPDSLGGLAALTQSTNPGITITVDALANQHPIDPNIYGLNNSDANSLNILNSPLNRYGGNRTSRYNWQVNTDSTAQDYYYESYPDANVPGGIADTIVQNSFNTQAQPMITIPMIDWIAKAGPNRSVLWSFSIQKYGSQSDSDVQYYPDAGNGIKPDGAYIVGNDPNDANIPNSTAFQQTFVNHLISKWGTAANGGVRYYILDNEHCLWYDTHRDVHPQGPPMEEIRDKMIAYAEMIRSQDSDALIVGPEEYGWTGYFLSGADKQLCEIKQAQGDFSCWSNPPDRAAHNNEDYIPWLLDQLYSHQTNTGIRILDVFTLHWYPQGPEYSNDVTNSTQLLRNRSTRSLWDPNYIDESWIQDKVFLIPRMKAWVQNHFPGVKTGITEYNWGAENHINGATAQADVLGIFGREGLDLATLYTDGPLDPSSFTGKAFRMYRNYDGNKSTFGDTSVQTVAPNPDNVSAFGAVRGSDGALTVMVIAKYLSNNTPATIQLNNFQSTGSAEVWQLTSGGTIQNLAPITFGGTSFAATLPPHSITLFVIPSSNPTPNFSISCNPATAVADPGNLAQTNCSLTPQAGYNQSVTLSCSGLPAGTDCTFGTNPVVVPGSSSVSIPANLPAGDYPFNVDASDGTISHSFAAKLHVNGQAQILFQDDFQDGIQAWSVHSGTWLESGGTLSSKTKKTSEIVSPAAFPGFTTGAVEADLSVNKSVGRSTLLSWYQSSTNTLELVEMPDKKKWQMNHKMNGITKGVSIAQIPAAGTVYHVKLTYDGVQFQVFINGSLAASLQPAGPPSGIVGLRVKSVNGNAVIGTLDNVNVYH